MKFEDKKFENITQQLDGNEFIRCEFINTKMVFSAESPVNLMDCTFQNVIWAFEGSAGLTLNFMAALYHGGGQELIENTFRDIRENHLSLPPETK